MTWISSILSLLVVCGLLLCCQPKPGETDGAGSPDAIELDEEQRAEFARRGEDAARALLENLSTQLKAALASGGPPTAVRVCQQAALPITTSTSGQFDNLTIRRTSLKVRNPKNAPDPDDRAILEAWHALLENGQPLPEHELQAAKEGARFYKPIVTAAVCLKCHGASESLDPDLRSLLDQLYPNDQARDYKEGDLRGAIRVDLASSE